MDCETEVFNRQVIRLCKGILKAWEQWVDESVEKERDRQEKSPSSKSSTTLKAKPYESKRFDCTMSS